MGRPVHTQYVRMYPQTTYGHMSLRAALLVQSGARSRECCYWDFCEGCSDKSKRHRAKYAHAGDVDFQELGIKVGKRTSKGKDRDEKSVGKGCVAASRLFRLMDSHESGHIDAVELSNALGLLEDCAAAVVDLTRLQLDPKSNRVTMEAFEKFMNELFEEKGETEFYKWASGAVDAL